MPAESAKPQPVDAGQDALEVGLGAEDGDSREAGIHRGAGRREEDARRLDAQARVAAVLADDVRGDRVGADDDHAAVGAVVPALDDFAFVEHAALQEQEHQRARGEEQEDARREVPGDAVAQQRQRDEARDDHDRHGAHHARDLVAETPGLRTPVEPQAAHHDVPDENGGGGAPEVFGIVPVAVAAEEPVAEGRLLVPAAVEPYPGRQKERRGECDGVGHDGDDGMDDIDGVTCAHGRLRGGKG